MANNVDITPGTGKTIATRETTIDAVAVHVQREILEIVRSGTHKGSASGMVLSDPDCGLYVCPRHFATITSASFSATTAAYTAGKAIGGGDCLVSSVMIDGCASIGVSQFVVIDKDNKKAPIDFVVMDLSPALDIPTPPANNVLWSPTLNDFTHVSDVISVTEADYITFGGVAIAPISFSPHKVWSASQGHPWFLPIARGAVTYGVTDALWLALTHFPL